MGWIERLGASLDRAARRLLPDPFVLALLLTFVVLLLSLAFGSDVARGRTLKPYYGDAPPVGSWWFPAAASVAAWFGGLWAFLAFAMEMSLILVTGHAVASAPPVRRLLVRLADVPRTPGAAVAFVGLVACVAAYVNWGLSLIVGATLARLVGESCARRGVAVHYPLLGAAGYVGLMVWHGGMSGSAPLTVATAGHKLESLTGVIPLDRTILALPNLALSAALLAAVPVLLALMHPRDGAAIEPYRGQGRLPAVDDIGEGVWLERHWLLAAMFIALGVAGLAMHFRAQGLVRGLNIDTMVLVFVLLGMALHGSPASYVRAIGEGAAGTAGILIQFPIYAGIQGLLAGTGLLEVAARGMVEFAGREAFPFLAFASAALVNLFVPSGGGQWMVQGPIVSATAAAVGAPQEDAVMALAYGDEWTNMLQPFWALPLLAITGLSARQVIGYTAAIMVLTAPLYAGALALGLL